MLFQYLQCVVLIIIVGVIGHGCITLKKECPFGEIHKSCFFYSEYTCWENSERLQRVEQLPYRLSHCTSGCYCKKGLVRAYPGGSCIVTAACRNQVRQEFLMKIPKHEYA